MQTSIQKIAQEATAHIRLLFITIGNEVLSCSLNKISISCFHLIVTLHQIWGPERHVYLQQHIELTFSCYNKHWDSHFANIVCKEVNLKEWYPTLFDDRDKSLLEDFIRSLNVLWFM